MKSPRMLLATGACLVAAALLASCGTPSTSAHSHLPKTLTVAYWTNFDTPGTNATPALVKAAAAELATQHPGAKVVLDPITTDSESTYYAKIDLAQRSPSTAPDVVMEDSFLIGSDASAGFIQPLPQLTKWSGWSQFPKAMQDIVTYDGQVYGVMNSTDVQLIYYSTSLFQKAGLPVPWQPRSLADIVSAAKAIHAHDPGVTPAWLYTGTPLGEASSFRGFEVFLDGTHDRLYDAATKKWETSGPGFTATWKFLAAMRPYEEPESDWSNPSAAATVDLSQMPGQQVGIVFDGSWVSTLFVKGGLKPWPGFFSAYSIAKFPSSGPGGSTDQSGGFAWSVAKYSKNPALALDLIEDLSSPSNLASFDAKDGNLPPRTDAISQPAWITENKIDPILTQASRMLAFTNYRPNQPDYPQVSNEIALLTGDISSGSMTPSQAEQAYAAKVTQIVGANEVEVMKS
ncbi:MAG: extracellular solute-binding protein [Acidimicrobiales bacterium]|jgi:multiple sugar transport system substrate-binding protein